MIKKKICFIAQFPPPIHGLSKAVETLYYSKLAKEFEFEKVDITNNKSFLISLFLILKSKSELFYFTISQTRGGNIRDLIILQLLSLLKKKCIIHLHGGYYRKLVDNDISNFQRKMNYKTIRKVEGAIVLSKSLKPIFKGMLDDNKIFIIPNCVDDEFLMTDTEYYKKVANLENKEILHVLYLSNFIRSKGYPKVLEIAKLEKERVATGGKKRLHFDFAGKFFEKSDEVLFDNFIADNNLEDFITYHGIVAGDKKRKLLKDCDVFILLTRYPNEGQPISILEAMGNGMLIVTTDYAGIPDIVTNKVNGIVASKNRDDAKNIYLQMCKLFDSIKDIEERNRIECLQKYTEQNYLESFRKVFKII